MRDASHARDEEPASSSPANAHGRRLRTSWTTGHEPRRPAHPQGQQTSTSYGRPGKGNSLVRILTTERPRLTRRQGHSSSVVDGWRVSTERVKPFVTRVSRERASYVMRVGRTRGGRVHRGCGSHPRRDVNARGDDGADDIARTNHDTVEHCRELSAAHVLRDEAAPEAGEPRARLSSTLNSGCRPRENGSARPYYVIRSTPHGSHLSP